MCPRHPDRVAYVRCQRCGRPTCPECQVQAAVGVQCVDCVREARAPAARSALGARLRGGPPVVTYTIVGLCVAMFVAQFAIDDLWFELGFVPALAELEPYRFITSAFLHSQSNFLHLAANMYLLWLVGPVLEELLGRARFVALYVAAALGGSVAVLLLSPPLATEAGQQVISAGFVTATIGASGAVFGLFGALLIVMRRLERNISQILVFFAINAVFGFVVPNVSWEGHLGGLVVGAALGAAFAFAPRERRQLVSWAAVGVVVVVLVALAAWRFGATTDILGPGYAEHLRQVL
ncbi:MAG: rhomboid family intramembrane serine protease [Actinomycetota bacterium]|nr:rhomboid family intramembrane serine protease [Actinomycetota bacterium]